MVIRILFAILVFLSPLYSTPLHKAVKEVNETKVMKFLEEGLDVNALDTHGKTPLHYAASIGRFSIVKKLVENGANPHIKDQSHKTPLVYAIEKNRIKVIIYLSQVANQTALQEDDPFFTAAKEGDIDLLSYHLARRDINSVNQDGKTALHIASEEGKLEIVSFLLNLGASKDLLDHDGRTALNYAKLSGNKALIELLSRP